MKFYTSLIHTIVKRTQTEVLFADLGKIMPFFLKFLPLSNEYALNEERVVKRDDTTFSLQLHDYMQWHVFARQPDMSWKIALDKLSNSSVILDVGANCGAFSLKLGQAAIKKGVQNYAIYAFEPNPLVCGFFNKNLSLNPSLQSFVKLQSIGIGRKSETLPMVFSNTNTGGGKIVERQEGQVLVSVQTLDSFVEANQLKNIAFIKIDVEGFEPFVIEGAKETIHQHKPAIFIEITDQWFREKDSSEVDIVNYFLSEGYQLFIEMHNRIVAFSFEKTKLLWQYNLIALP